MFMTALIIILVLVWFYILFAREWLMAKWPETFSKWHEMENKLWDRSRTILMSRAYWLLGGIVSIHEYMAAAGYDMTSISTQISQALPERYRPYIPIALGGFMIFTGMAFEWLRKQTTEPLEAKEPNKPIT